MTSTSAVLDACRRAAADLFDARVLLLTLAPLAIVGGLATLAAWLGFDAAIAAVQSFLDSIGTVSWLLAWLTTTGSGWIATSIAAIVVVLVAVPVLVVLALVVVALLMTPAIVTRVAARRFPTLARLEGGGFWRSLAWSLGSTALALAALVVSIPFWLVPPLVLVLPPLIWGWLTQRVFAYDALAAHASAEERRALMRTWRWPLLGMGFVCGYLGAAPALLWAFGALNLVLAPVLLVVSVWLHTLVFAFSALWFTHLLLAALDARRRASAIAGPATRRGAPTIQVLRPSAGETR
jgi:hypothetical protein